MTEFAITTNTALMTSNMQNNSPEGADEIIGTSARISLTPPKRGKNQMDICE